MQDCLELLKHKSSHGLALALSLFSIFGPTNRLAAIYLMKNFRTTETDENISNILAQVWSGKSDGLLSSRLSWGKGARRLLSGLSCDSAKQHSPVLVHASCNTICGLLWSWWCFPVPAQRAWVHTLKMAVLFGCKLMDITATVSYTHLTLPTIPLV